MSLPSAERVLLLRCYQIEPGMNDRTVFNWDALEELADSISDHGLDSPVTVRPTPLLKKVPNNGWTAGDPRFCLVCEQVERDCMCTHYRLVAGERRFRAISQILKWDTIPAFVREMDEETASVAMLSENMDRADLDVVDEYLAYEKRMRQFGWDEAALSKRIGIRVERIKKRLKLAGVREELLALVRSGNFPVGHAEVISKLDHNRQMLAARPLVEGARMNYHDFVKVVEKLYQEQISVSLFDLALFGGPLQEMPAAKAVEVQLPPPASRLPILDVTGDGVPRHTGALLYNYYLRLVKAGRKREADAILNALHGLADGNYVRLPTLISYE